MGPCSSSYQNSERLEPKTDAEMQKNFHERLTKNKCHIFFNDTKERFKFSLCYYDLEETTYLCKGWYYAEILERRKISLGKRIGEVFITKGISCSPNSKLTNNYYAFNVGDWYLNFDLEGTQVTIPTEGNLCVFERITQHKKNVEGIDEIQIRIYYTEEKLFKVEYS